MEYAAVPAKPSPPNLAAPEPRWPAALAILATGIILAGLPDELSVGPRWLVVGLVFLLEIPSVIAHKIQWYRFNHNLGFMASGVLTVFLLWSLTLLVVALPQHKVDPVTLLRSAALLWLGTIIVFAVWYWRLDAGGPNTRDELKCHTEGAFLFPQMTLAATRGKWSPHFVDYLFIAFNTSTAFSPTDVPILSAWAKILLMLQSLISLTIVVTLCARSINTIGS